MGKTNKILRKLRLTWEENQFRTIFLFIALTIYSKANQILIKDNVWCIVIFFFLKKYFQRFQVFSMMLNLDKTEKNFGWPKKIVILRGVKWCVAQNVEMRTYVRTFPWSHPLLTPSNLACLSPLTNTQATNSPMGNQLIATHHQLPTSVPQNSYLCHNLLPFLQSLLMTIFLNLKYSFTTHKSSDVV